MLRKRILLLVSVLAVSACGNRMQSKDKVQEAILKRLETRSGLDLKSLDVTTTSVSFNKNLAYATVAFHPKGDPKVNGGMVMRYTLEDRNGSWEVINVGDSHGGKMSGQSESGGSRLPPGHPGVAGLPPGHPQVGAGTEGRAQ